MNNGKFERLGVMIDNSRNGVMKPEKVKDFIDLISSMGYNALLLYTEETYEVKNQPYFGHNRGRYSISEIKSMDEYARTKGVELIPCIQTLAHLERIFRWSVYSQVRDTDNILLVGEEETYKLIDDMFASLAESYTSRIVNIGMDEAGMVGRGKYLDRYGLKDRFDILLEHLGKISDIAKKYGFHMTMWGDMFLGREELWESAKENNLIPDNLDVVYWDYYSTSEEKYDNRFKLYSSLEKEVWFAGGSWSWTGFIPHNRFSNFVTKKAFNQCFEHGVKNVFLTMWGDDGNEGSKFTLLPALYYASQLAIGNDDESAIKEGFKEKFGIAYDDFMLIDLPGTPNDRETEVVNCDKYLLYNDCFMGLFDNMVTDDLSEKFAALVPKLTKLIDNENYGYLFNTAKALCEVLELKCNIGNETRKAYKSGDKEALKKLLDKYEKLILKLEEFYDVFEIQWMTDNKPQGFDVQDARFGGLIRRVTHCKERIMKYLNGEISSIDELNEDVLDIICREENQNFHIAYNKWSDIITANAI